MGWSGMCRNAGLALCLVLAAAAAGLHEPARAEDSAHPAADAGPPTQPVASQETAKPAGEPRLEVGDSGVAGIDADTPFDPMAVRQKLPPGYAVTSGTYRGEDEPLRNINVLRNDLPVLSLYPGPDEKVSLIQVLSPAVAVGAGRIGSSFAEFFPDGPAPDCFPGAERLSGMVICSHPDSRRVNLLFEGQDWEGPPDALPPPEVLQHWPLKYVIWSAVPRPEEAGTEPQPEDGSGAGRN